MKVIVEQCSRAELFEFVRFLKKVNSWAFEESNALRAENKALRAENKELRAENEHLKEVIHELGSALDHVNDILYVYHISTLGIPDDEK